MISMSATLWAIVLAMHLLCRALTASESVGRPRRCLRHLFAEGLPLAIVIYFVCDHFCGTSGASLPEWASRACNATGAPHFDSWSDLANGVFSAGASATQGDELPMVLLCGPRLLAWFLSVVALFMTAVCDRRLVAQHVHDAMAPRPWLESWSASCAFFFVCLAVWLLELVHVADRRWVAPHGTLEDISWLAVISGLVAPMVGIAAGIGWCTSTRGITRSHFRDTRVYVQRTTPALSSGGAINGSTRRSATLARSACWASTQAAASDVGRPL